MKEDNYIYQDSCKQYNGGSLSLVFNTPTHMDGFYWNIDKLVGEVLFREYRE